MAMKPPNAARLYEAALNHLARYAATERGLALVLGRKVDRWLRVQEEDVENAASLARASKAGIPDIVARLKAAGLLSDEACAASRARRLARAGKSRAASLAHLAAKGVAGALAGAALADDPERELASACVYLRRRRAGPFGDAPELKILAAMARAGFSQTVARQSMRLNREEAEARIKALDT